MCPFRRTSHLLPLSLSPCLLSASCLVLPRHRTHTCRPSPLLPVSPLFPLELIPSECPSCFARLASQFVVRRRAPPFSPPHPSVRACPSPLLWPPSLLAADPSTCPHSACTIRANRPPHLLYASSPPLRRHQRPPPLLPHLCRRRPAGACLPPPRGAPPTLSKHINPMPADDAAPPCLPLSAAPTPLFRAVPAILLPVSLPPPFVGASRFLPD